jgi:SET domain-containing protein
MAYLEKYLYLKKSGLPGAGFGLFTKVEIRKGTRIVEYKGRLQPWKEVKHEDGYNPYLFKINSRIAVNAESYKKSFGRYANDARGFARIKGLRNNSEYEVEGKKVYIDAIRNIKRNEEILVEYGGNFWALMKKIRKEKMKGSSKKSK